MSRGFDTWYSFADLDRVARRGKALETELAVGKLTRLAGLLSSEHGAVNANVSMKLHTDGTLGLQLESSAQVELTCQRCLEPMSCTLQSSIAYQIIDEGLEEPADGEARQTERIVLNGGRMNLLQLLEDELIVALPFSPRHEDKAACGHVARRIEELNTTGGDRSKDVSVDL